VLGAGDACCAQLFGSRIRVQGRAVVRACRMRRSCWSVKCRGIILRTTLHLAGMEKTLQDTARHCNTLQHTATHYNTLQHTATHCNTL